MDMRYKYNKQLTKTRRVNTITSLVILALLGSSIIYKRYVDYTQRPLINPKGSGEVTRPIIKEVQAVNIPFCYDPITCIRDVGEELGEPNDHIKQMIRIAKAESGMRPDALNKNKNGTFDVGLFQINDIHNKRISRIDRMDYQKNIRFAYQLHREQGHSFTAWVTFNRGLAND